jgi:WD40 repeat protein
MCSVSNDGALRLWDVSSIAHTGQPEINRRRCLATLDAHAGDAYAVTFLPDGSVAAGYIDGAVRIWHLEEFDRYTDGHVEFQKQRRLGLSATVSQ